MLVPILYSALSGIVGTGVGGVLGLFFVHRKKSVLGVLLAFAAGLMIGVSCFDLIPEALALANLWDTLLGAAVGALLVAGINGLLSLFHRPLSGRKAVSDQGLTRSGYLMLVAIALHNLPEGLAIGASGGHDQAMGLTVAVLLAIHDIPEGMSIVLPLCAGGMGRGKAALLAALSGVPTLVGGMMGAWMSVTPGLVGVSLAVAGGAMLYVTFCEMIPQIMSLQRSRGALAMVLVGVLAGLAAVQLLEH